MTEINSSPRQEALNAKHASLEAKISEESAKVRPDELKIQELKRQKLAVKDAMAPS